MREATLKTACIQLTSMCNPADNLPIIETRIRAAAQEGARLIALPETCTFMEKGKKAMQARLVTEADSAALAHLAALAEQLDVHLLIGSMVLKPDDASDERAVNRSLLLTPDGKVAARYDKIHMFDVTLADGESHSESRSYRAGTAAVVAAVDDALLGMSICYDVRFPALYRRLAEAGADILSVPSAFTRPTGAAHWHVLLRARAIETGCFVIAPAQIGVHENGRETYGHSLMIDPWGNIIAEAADEDAFIIATLDLSLVDKARAQIPALAHGRTFHLPDGTPTQD